MTGFEDLFSDDEIEDGYEVAEPPNLILVPHFADERYLSGQDTDDDLTKARSRGVESDGDYDGEDIVAAHMLGRMNARHTTERAEEHRVFNEAIRDEIERQRVQIVARREAYKLIDAGKHREVLAKLPDPMTPTQMLECASDAPKFRVDRLIPTNGNLLLCARPKAGKTERGFQLAKSLLTGDDFLGEFEVVPVNGTILNLNYELTSDMAAGWMNDMGLDDDRMLTFNLRGFSVPLLSDDGAAWLIEQCTKYGVEVLQIDPAARMMTSAGVNAENDNDAVKAICDRLDAIKQEAGVTEMIVAIHANRVDPICRPRGADAWTAWMDSQINFEFASLETTTGPRFISAIGRDVSLSKRELAYDKTTRLATYKVKHSVDTDENGDPLVADIDFGGGGGRGRKVDSSVYDERVSAYLEDHPEASKAQVRKNVKGGADRLDAAYDRVRHAGGDA
ncbi:AAA family ATPase [Gordonia sp. MMO-8]|uniref:AAA family ATPase n=1 Tax=Gordonia sp. MMO-8 TaxID=3127886 RepID=UPI0030158C9C